MATQINMLMHHFDNVNSISPMEAHTVYKIRSLPRRIMDLKERGYEFRSEWNTDLSGQRYKRYYLLVDPNKGDEQ
tara:strand:- start:352 stop:576 length:225 start_codon:yes stop_codon:yes gene_type:complete